MEPNSTGYWCAYTPVTGGCSPTLSCLQALLSANDFIGLSAYGSNYPTDASQLTYHSMEVPLYTLAYELSFFGIDLKDFMDRPVLYVEQVGEVFVSCLSCVAAWRLIGCCAAP